MPGKFLSRSSTSALTLAPCALTSSTPWVNFRSGVGTRTRTDIRLLLRIYKNHITDNNVTKLNSCHDPCKKWSDPDTDTDGQRVSTACGFCSRRRVNAFAEFIKVFQRGLHRQWLFDASGDGFQSFIAIASDADDDRLL